MSRAWLPRRFPAGIPAALLALTLCAAAPSAIAQEARAVQVIGGDRHASRCITGINAGDSSDAVLEECTRALDYPRLTRAAETTVRINRGVVYLRRNAGELALADFDAVIAHDDDNGEAYLNRGAALMLLRQYGPAIISITRAMQFGVQQPHKAYFNRGAAREALGDLRGAFEDYSTALEIQPDWGPASEELARFARARRDHLATVLEEDAPGTP